MKLILRLHCNVIGMSNSLAFLSTYQTWDCAMSASVRRYYDTGQITQKAHYRGGLSIYCGFHFSLESLAEDIN